MKPHKWTMNEQAHFMKRMGELLARGYPIAEAIESISLHLPLMRQEELRNGLHDLKKGFLFHDVLISLGFHKDLIGYVYFAEQHGSFAEALLEGSELALTRDHDRRKLVKLLQYPMVLIVITGFLLVFVQKSLLPKFTGLFNTMSLEPNIFMKFLSPFDHYFPIISGGLLVFITMGTIYYLLVFRRTSVLKQREMYVRIPIVGGIFKLLFTHYFSIQFSFLISGGLSVFEALQLFEQNRQHPFYSQVGKLIKQKLLTGERLETILAEFPFFEKEFPTIIKHGQENGKLEQELRFFSQLCVARLEERIEKSLKWIQPVLYLIIGFLVVSMYLAILLPMFHLLNGI